MNLYANLSIELCNLAAIRLSGVEESLRDATVRWTAEWIFREINPSELADDAMQSIRVHNNKSIDTAEQIEKVIADEVAAWNKKIQADVSTATKAVISMRCWMTERNSRKRLKKVKHWINDDYGFQWWVSMDILSIDRRCVILAALETGLIEEAAVDQITKDFKFGKYGHITKNYAKKWQVNNSAHWPVDWRAAWESGKMQRDCKLSKINNEVVAL